MFKKLTLLVMAVCAIAALSAPSAFASVTANGASPEGSFTASGSNLKTLSESGGALECSNVTLNGTWGEDVTEVEALTSSGVVTGTATGGEAGGACKTNNPNVIVDFSNISVTNLSLGETGGGADVAYTMTLTAKAAPGTSIGHCHYKGHVTFGYPHDAALSLKLMGEKQLEQTLEGTCPIAGKGAKATLSGDLAVSGVEITTP